MLWIIIPKNPSNYVSPEKFALGNVTSQHGVQFASDDCSFVALYRTREEAREALRDSQFTDSHCVRRVFVEVE